MDVQVTDTQPKRAHDISDLTNAFFAIFSAVALTLVSLYLHGLTTGVEADAHTVGGIVDEWLFELPLSLLSQMTMVIITFTIVIQLLIHREWLQTIISLAAFLLGIGGAIAVSSIITAIGYSPLIQSLQSSSSVQFLLPELFAGLAAFLTCAGPRYLHPSLVWCWNGLFSVAAILIMLSANSLVGMTVSILLGRTIGLLIRYTIGSPNIGIWSQDIALAVRNTGLEPTSISFIGDTKSRLCPYSVNDDVTFNSRRYLVACADGKEYIVSIADAQRHSSSYLRQLWQWIRLTDLPMRRDRSVTDITHHHYLMLLAVRDIGLDAIQPYAVTDFNESSVLILKKNNQLTMADPSSITRKDAEHVFRYISRAHQRGITHRHISYNSLARNAQGDLILAGWENGDITSNHANIAVDRAQLLTLMALCIGTDEAILAARNVWDKDTLTSLAPFTQNVIIPASVRDHSGFTRNLTRTLRSALASIDNTDDIDNVELVSLSRFSVRNFISAFLVVIALVVILTQFNMHAVIDSVRKANPWFAALSLIAGCLSWLGTSLTLGAYTDNDKRNIAGIFASQVAQSFAAVSMPAGVGPAFVNLRFLRKTGHKNTVATAAMSAVIAVQFVTTFVLMVVLGLFTGKNGLTNLLPTGTLAIVLAVLALLIALSMIISPIRKFILSKLIPQLKNYARQLVLLLTQPGRLVVAALGSVLQNLMLGLSFWAALNAFNAHVGFIETTFIFLVANTIGSAAPTPGGLGGVETTLTVAFTGVGVPSAVALSAALLFRVMTYWLRIPLGALSMKWMSKKNLI